MSSAFYAQLWRMSSTFSLICLEKGFAKTLIVCREKKPEK